MKFTESLERHQVHDNNKYRYICYIQCNYVLFSFIVCLITCLFFCLIVCLLCVLVSCLEAFLIRAGIYFILEKLKTVALRNLFKKVLVMIHYCSSSTIFILCDACHCYFSVPCSLDVLITSWLLMETHQLSLKAFEAAMIFNKVCGPILSTGTHNSSLHVGMAPQKMTAPVNVLAVIC